MKAMKKFTQNGALGILPLLTSLMILVLAGCELESSSGGSDSDDGLTDSGTDADADSDAASGEDQTYSNISVEFAYASDATIPAKSGEYKSIEVKTSAIPVTGYTHLYAADDPIYLLFCSITDAIDGTVTNYNCNVPFFSEITFETTDSPSDLDTDDFSDFDDSTHSWEDADGNTRTLTAVALVQTAGSIDVYNNAALSPTSVTLAADQTEAGGLLLPVKGEMVTASVFTGVDDSGEDVVENIDLLLCKGDECASDFGPNLWTANDSDSSNDSDELPMGTILVDRDLDGYFGPAEFDAASSLEEATALADDYSIVDTSISGGFVEGVSRYLSPVEWIMGFQAYLVPAPGQADTGSAKADEEADPDSEDLSEDTISVSSDMTFTITFSNFQLNSSVGSSVDLATEVPFFQKPDTILSVTAATSE